MILCGNISDCHAISKLYPAAGYLARTFHGYMGIFIWEYVYISPFTYLTKQSKEHLAFVVAIKES